MGSSIAAMERALADQGLCVLAVPHEGLGAIDGFMPHAIFVETGASVVSTCNSIRAIRNRHPEVRLVALGQGESPREIAFLLAAGAEDYLPMPQTPQDIAAAARSPRHAERRGHVLREPGVTLDEIAMTVSVHGRKIALTAIECSILARLMREPGAVISPDTLLSDAWPLGVPGTLSALRTHVRDLRKKIERNASLPTCIVSVRGRGYTFRAEA